MGGATRFKMLLATPFPSLLLHHHRPSSLLFLRRFSTSSTTTSYPRHLTLCPSIKSFQQQNLHTRPLNSHTPNQLPLSHPWAEWSQFISALTSSLGQQSSSLPDHGLDTEDALVVYEEKELPDEFLRFAAASLAFARARPELLGLLSRRDIEVIVTNGTPFLFKTALDTARRMRAYLAADGGNVLESANPSTVDIMKYILSYASKPVGSSVSNSLFSRELVESSIRNLLRQIRQVSFGDLEQDMPASQQDPFPGYDQTSRPLGQHVQMKRGDWICPKCSFMNFARNVKCLECEEPRPKRQLTGGEWECPQCNFFNFGKKMVCLRCDCKRSGEVVSQLGYSGYNLDKTSMDGKLGESGNRWFNEDSQLNNASKLNHLGIAVEQSVQRNPSASFPSSSPSEYKHSSTSNTRHVPFVPLPADMFAKQNQDLKPELGKDAAQQSGHSVFSAADHERAPATPSSDSWKLGADDPFSGKPEVHSGSERNDEAQDEKAERWFQRAEELNDVKDVPNAISDDDFPEIMPMRKGENRFVVSKKKDRSLTSPAYKRQVAMEQGRNPDFVPFVPFPPGYFAKKDQEAPDNIDSSTKTSGETCSSSTVGESIPGRTADLMPRPPKYDSVKETVNQGRISGDQSPRLSGVHMSPLHGNLGQNTSTSQSPKHEINMHRFSTEKDKFQTMDAPRGSAQFHENQNTRSVGAGKSLEGSAVKETDPLDMSEEAKAERWFRRVAQIKDISELSQIPDEDFPSIMPMRKGVNRFVVSKRKTPLERRLTSPQYRRNLPSMVSDRVKKDNDSS